MEGQQGPGSTTTAPSTTATTKSMSVFVWSPSESGQGSHIPTHIKVAFGIMAATFLFIIIAFSTPAWLETDGEMIDPKSKFLKIGLWEGCFDDLPDANHNYDIRISGCWYLLSEELYHLNDLIFKRGNISGRLMEQFRVDYGRSGGAFNKGTYAMDDYMGAAYYKKRHMAGTVGVAVFTLTAILILVAFVTPYWLESDRRIVGAKFEKLGLWSHCFRSLSDPNDQYLNRFFTGCRWIFDPFTTGYQEIRSFLVPPFFVAVQFFFTMCFIFLLISIVLVPMYILCFGPDHNYFVMLIRLIGIVLLASAFLGTIAVIVFGAMGDSRAWMPDWQNNYLSWSFAFAVIGVFGEYVSGILFLVEARIQGKQRKLRESHSAYTMETKA